MKIKLSSKFGIPLLKIFTPIALGIFIAKYLTFHQSFAIAFALIILKIINEKYKITSVKYTKYFILLGIIILYSSFRFDHPSNIEKSQIYKIIYDLNIEKINFKEKNNKIYGYGKIIKIYGEKYQSLVGHRIYFYINGEQKYIPSQILKIKSGLRILQPHISESFFSYLVQKKIYLYGYRGEVLKIIKKETYLNNKLSEVGNNLRECIKSYCEKYGHDDSENILYGILLSEKKELTKEQRNNFSNTGVAHLLAVSGLHIGIISIALDFLLHCFFLTRKIRRCPVLILLFIYVGVIGFPPSAIRAWIMISCLWGASIFLRKSSGISSLLFSAILILLYDPILLFDISFQLSYGIVAIILLLGPSIREVLLYVLKKWNLYAEKEIYKNQRKWNAIVWNFSEIFSISIATGLASAPLTFEYFNMFSLVGIFLSPIIMQIALPTISSGFLFLLMNFLFQSCFLTDLLFIISKKGVEVINKLLFFTEKYIPWHIEFLTKPKGIGILIFLIFLFASVYIYNLQKYFQWKTIHYHSN